MTQTNLDPIRTTDEARRRGAAGGRASGVARRAKRAMKERLQALLDSQVDGAEGFDALALALFDKALSGDTKAIELVMTYTGQNQHLLLPEVALPKLEGPRDIPTFSVALLQAVVNGQLTPEEGQKLAGLAATLSNVQRVSLTIDKHGLGVTDGENTLRIRPLSPREALMEMVARARAEDEAREQP